ncbi:MAG: hypothetical protein V1703_04015 [Candidatus Altiarchaeota archaeon]
MEVLIKKIMYIVGVPAELTAKAVAAGEIKKGSIVGLNVEFIGQGIEGLIELRILRNGQESLVREGAVIPVEEGESMFFMQEHWSDYSESPSMG